MKSIVRKRIYDSSRCKEVKIGTVNAVSSASVNSIARTKKSNREIIQRLFLGRGSEKKKQTVTEEKNTLNDLLLL